eukprot:m.4446 g.4446  ORF g.4446 m.4446 type:complete len:425 (-) comp2987_c0_seq1:207-1481(-)
MPPNVEVRKREAAIAADASPTVEKEVLINGRWYDVQSFAKRHPGGRILNYYLGKDGSDAFNEFHNRSEKAKKMLTSIKSRPYNNELKEDRDAALTKDFQALRKELMDEGFFEPSIPHVIYRISEIILMHAIGFYALFNGWSFAAIAILGLAQGRCGWLMHEGGHHSLTGYIPLDISIQVILYGVGSGMSAAFWRNQHNKHHATPQKLEHDVDLDTLPLVMFNERVKEGPQGKMLNKTWVRLQGYLFAPVTCLLVALGWQLFLHPRHMMRTKRYHELATLVVRYTVVAYLLACPQFSVTGIILGYIAYVWVGAVYIFCNFAVSHTHKPVLSKDEDVSWVRYASDHTMNVDAGSFGWVNWWMSYLNFQIEHHLFPSMPQFRHPIVSPRVQKLFKKHGVEYDTMPYWPAMYKTFNNLDNVGRDVFYG